MSDSVWPQRRQPTRLSRPWDSPGRNTGMGCHFLLQQQAPSKFWWTISEKQQANFVEIILSAHTASFVLWNHLNNEEKKKTCLLSAESRGKNAVFSDLKQILDKWQRIQILWTQEAFFQEYCTIFSKNMQKTMKHGGNSKSSKKRD